MIGEELVLETEDSNQYDEQVVTIMKDGCVSMHMCTYEYIYRNNYLACLLS